MSRLVEPIPVLRGKHYVRDRWYSGVALPSRAPSEPLSRDSYVERIAKYIPSEVLAAYIALNGFIANARAATRFWLYVVSFVFCLVLTPVYLSKVARRGQPKKLHLVIATLAFGLWAYSLGGIFAELQIHDSAVASVLLVMFSLVSGFIQPTVTVAAEREAAAAD